MRFFQHLTFDFNINLNLMTGRNKNTGNLASVLNELVVFSIVDISLSLVFLAFKEIHIESH